MQRIWKKVNTFSSVSVQILPTTYQMYHQSSQSLSPGRHPKEDYRQTFLIDDVLESAEFNTEESILMLQLFQEQMDAVLYGATESVFVSSNTGFPEHFTAKVVSSDIAKAMTGIDSLPMKAVVD